MMARSQRLGSAALASGVRAMTPIHKAATANQRRLGPKALGSRPAFAAGPLDPDQHHPDREEDVDEGGVEQPDVGRE